MAVGRWSGCELVEVSVYVYVWKKRMEKWRRREMGRERKWGGGGAREGSGIENG